MTPPTLDARWLRLRVQLGRSQTLREIRRIGFYLLALCAWLWFFTRWIV